MKTCYASFDLDSTGFCHRAFLGNGGRTEHNQAPTWLCDALYAGSNQRRFVLAPGEHEEGFEVYNGLPLPSDSMHTWDVETCVLPIASGPSRFHLAKGEGGNDNRPTVFLMNPQGFFSRPPKDPEARIQHWVRSVLGIRLPECEPLYTGAWSGPNATFAAWADDGMLVVTIDDRIRPALTTLHAAAIGGQLAVRYGIFDWASESKSGSGLELTIVL